MNRLTGLLCLMMAMGAAAQQRPAKTADGHPDLEGVWTYGTVTPFERPPQFGEKAFFTGDEAEQFHRMLFLAVQKAAASRFVPDFGERDRPFLTVDGHELTSVIQDPPDGRVPALTPEARRQSQTLAFDRLDSARDVPLYERCIKAASWPPLQPGTINANVQIVQTPTHVVLVQEDQYGARVIPTDGQPRPAGLAPTWLGDSRGRWDGDTLVIDTINFREQLQQRVVSARFDSHLHLVERVTFVNDRLLRYDFRIDDPTVFVKPWSGTLMLRKTDAPIYEVACHEGNYSIANMLRGARAQDAAR